ncbi:hypothetical protein TGAMA5MH_03841 [Trichoderma gamsii]|uniref:BTB domain-containing protein n=1 Tax=Trichoderma gamsii TaxID=398673 RepID=A0A2K0TFD9_9HYPO|nr:hypothetical protein TGAMA5MH_03841 [Trichoderma gamsii]
MKRQSFELDPRGDVCLILRQPNQQELIWNPSASVTPSSDQGEEEKSDESAEPKPESEGKLPGGLDEPNESNELEEVQFRLSSRHLCLASPVFNAMLSGDWKESNGTFESPEKVTEMETRKTSDTRLQLRYEIAATEWNVEAFTLLMNIIHGHHRKVPRSIDLDTLAMVSVLVDYYKCHEITDVFAQMWVVKLSPGLPTSYGRESMIWLFVSWVFSESLIFQQMTALVMKEGDCSLETTSLPLPPLLLGMQLRLNTEDQV